MTNERKKLNTGLKQYQMLILGCILSALLILNSNYLDDQRSQKQLYKEKSQLFDKIISLRKLDEPGGDANDQDDTPANDQDGTPANDQDGTPADGNEDVSKNLEGTEKVCKKSSESLREYYKTGDLSKIELKEGKIECEDKDKDYFKALLNIIKTATGEKEEGENSRNLVEMNFDEIQDDAISYAKHIIPIAAFLVIALLSIPGWIICCFCCCCNCCCCCCCKKPGCKIPCFIFTYVFYALAVAICFYGLSQTSHIFVGLADTECSILKFFDEILYGEMKQEKPRWAGIDGINDILGDISSQVEDLGGTKKGELDEQKRKIDEEKTTFEGVIHSFPNNFIPYTTDYKETYHFVYGDGVEVDGSYVLDMIKFLGEYDTDKFVPENSFLDIWRQEYEIISTKADEYLKIAQDSFTDIVKEGTEDIVSQLNDGKNMLNNIKNTFNDIKSEIADSIVEYSDVIDEYGKLGSNLVFGVLALMNIALAVLVLLICFCSGKMCTNCCCCRCICKFFTHLLWNVLALLMIITFLVGFIFSFVGSIGYDVMSVISYVVSEENLHSENGILVDKLDGASTYLDKCINGDGKIEEAIGLGETEIGSFDKINEVEEQIDNAKSSFQNITQCFAFNAILDELNKRSNLTSEELVLIKEGYEIENLKDIDTSDHSNFLPFKGYLQLMNEFIGYKNDPDLKQENWKVGTGEGCVKDGPDGTPSSTEFDLLKCKPVDRDWINQLGAPDNINAATTVDAKNDVNIKVTSTIVSDTIEFLKKAKDKSNTNSFLSKLDGLRDQYKDHFLKQYIDTLDEFGDMIHGIVDKLNEYIDKDKGGVFGFINGKFIGTNLKIILKYLKSALGTDIKTIGICLLIVGCSLALSISSTILLIVVINVDIDNNKQSAQIPEYKMSSGGRVIQYQ